MMRRILTILCLLLILLPIMGEAEEPRKVVYLTFDDGPKQSTPELLELLEELDVPATFFMVGFAVRAFPEYAFEIYEKGYAIGCHTMDHSSSGIKENPEQLESILRRFNEEVQKATGDAQFATTLFRFPGGSTQYPYAAKKKVTDLGYSWFDWNAMTRDTYSDMNKKEILKAVKRTTGEQEVVILLAHDGKKFTRDALPEIVEFYRENGYEFRQLADTKEEREILSRCAAHLAFPEQ